MKNKLVIAAGVVSVLTYGYFQVASELGPKELDAEQTLNQVEEVQDKVLTSSVSNKKQGINPFSVIKDPDQPQNLVSGQPDLETDNTELELELEQVEVELLSLLNCRETYSCPQDDSDPRASAHLLGQKISQGINKLADLYKSNGVNDTEAAKITRKFIPNGNGYVQEAVIEFMAMQPPNEENALILIDALANGYDPKIMTQGMKELGRYPQLNNEMDTMFTDILKHGPFNVSKELARQIKTFINADNLAHYQEVSKTLPSNSAKARYLRSAIVEAQMRVTKG